MFCKMRGRNHNSINILVSLRSSRNPENFFRKYFEFTKNFTFRKKFMNKNAIKFEILGVRGLNIIQKRAKTGEFSAILGQKPGKFGDKFD